MTPQGHLIVVYLGTMRHSWELSVDLSSVHVFSPKFPVLGRIVPEGEQRIFRNKYIAFVFFV